MDTSYQSSTHSAETDVLVKIPNDFFEPILEKSHFSNDNDFICELDNFLLAEHQQHKEGYNSVRTEIDSFQKTDDDLNLQEERLKREHQEKLTDILQKKMIQYKQKVVALSKLVNEKDQLILKLRKNEGLDEDNIRLKQRIASLQEEVNNTIKLINKFQSKNEALELKIENLTITSSEMREISKRQLKDLEIRLSNSQVKEQESQKEIDNLSDKLKTEKEKFFKEKNARTRIEQEVNSLKAQLKQAKDESSSLCVRFEKDMQIKDAKQKKIFNNLLNEFSEKERKLIKEMDMQRDALKNYYQAQLEEALEQKVIEFQKQLEEYQREIKHEFDEREKNHTERAISQMEMIVQK